MARQLTAHQRVMLNYIQEFQMKRGYSPSMTDLAIAFGVRSKNAVFKTVNQLQREGCIEKDPIGRIKMVPLAFTAEQFLRIEDALELIASTTTDESARTHAHAALHSIHHI